MKLTKVTYLWLAGILAVAIGVASAAEWATTRTVTVPEGTALRVRLDESLSTAGNRSGDEFTATVDEPVVVDGKTVIPHGAVARGRVTDLRESGRLKGRAFIRLELTSVEVGNSSYNIVTGGPSRVGPGHKKRNWWSIGGGAAGGALIGGLAGGGKGLLIGAPIGAGAGLTYALLTGKKDIRVPAETPLTFRLEEPVKVKTS